MKQVILIHGAPYENEFYDPSRPSPSNANWFPWLQKQVALKDGLSQALEFPKPYDPVYENWARVLEQMQIGEETILIGHSCGGGFLLRFLSENASLKPKRVVLVAPWLDPDHELTTDFFTFEIDSELATRTDIHVFISSDDDAPMQKTVETLREKIPGIIIHQFTDKEHFNQKDFPELLEII